MKKGKNTRTIQITRKTLNPSIPNAGVKYWYYRALRKHISAMSDDVINEIENLTKQSVLANDASPAALFRYLLRRLTTRWSKRFNQLSKGLAKTFCECSADTIDKPLIAQLIEMGFAFDFKMTDAMQNTSTAIIAENVSLIKSIPQQYFTRIETLVMQSVARGGDLGELKKQLKQQFGVTDRRARLIATDQNRKASSSLAAIRQQSLGIKKGIWLHTGAGQHPRPDHVAANGREFDITKGCLIGGKYILPGQEINCGCTWRPVLPHQ